MVKVKTTEDGNMTLTLTTRFRLAATDIDIKPEAEVIEFTGIDKSGLEVDLRRVGKQFPNVKKIIIRDGVYEFNVSNLMFPNVRELDVSQNSKFRAVGTALYRKRFGKGRVYTLNNVFGKPDDLELDLSEVSIVSAHSLAGCHITKIKGFDKEIEFDNMAFAGSENMRDSFKNGIVCVSGFIINADTEADNVIIPDGVVGVNPSVDMSTLKCATFSDIKSIGAIKYLPKKVVINTDKKIPIFDFMNAMRYRSETCGEFVCENNPIYFTVDGILYSGTKLLKCPGLKCGHVEIPDFVTEIDSGAFEKTLIDGVTIPDSVKIMRSRAFAHCTVLKSVSIGKGIDTIPEFAFFGCEMLEEIDIPSNVRRIERAAFTSCDRLNTINLHEGLKEIASGAIVVNSDTITLPASLEYVGSFNFIYIKKLNVIGRLPDNALFSVFETQPTGADSSGIVEINISGKTIYAPKHMQSVYIRELQENLSGMDIDDIDSAYLNTLYKKALFNEEYQDMAVFMYEKFRDPELEKSFRRSGKSIALRYYKNGKTEQLIGLIKLDILTPAALKALEKEASKCNDTTIKAYILDAVNKTDNTKTTFKL